MFKGPGPFRYMGGQANFTILVATGAGPLGTWKEADKFVLREYLDRGYLFGFFQFTTRIIPYDQVVQLAANAAE